MGLFGRIFRKSEQPTKGKPGRPKGSKNLTVAEKDKLEELRFLRQLKKEDPDLYRERMLERVGLSTKRRENPLQSAKQTLKELTEITDLIRRDDPTDNSMGKELLTALPAIIQMWAAMQGQNMQQQQAQYQTPQPQPEPVAAQLQPEPQPVEADAPEFQQAPMSLPSQWLVSQLDGKSSIEAASWLHTQNNEIAVAFVQQLCSTPDEHLKDLVTAMASQNPALAGFAYWLGQHWPWFIETVHELRKLEQPKKQDFGL